jgi:hypothetical protein
MKLHNVINTLNTAVLSVVLLATACASPDIFKDPNMDFGSVTTVAVMPLRNLSKEQEASERVRDVFMTMLLATRGVYVLPAGEVARGLALAAIQNPFTPSKEEIIKFGAQAKVDAVITGVVREYGEVRSGSASANVISLSMQMMEVQSGKVIWSVSSTQGGIGFSERLFGGGGEPLNNVTERAVADVINKFYK